MGILNQSEDEGCCNSSNSQNQLAFPSEVVDTTAARDTFNRTDAQIIKRAPHSSQASQ